MENAASDRDGASAAIARQRERAGRVLRDLVADLAPDADAAGAAATHAGGDGRGVPRAACVAVSACLLGAPCRYDGRAKEDAPVRRLVALLREQGCAVAPVCPEAAGRLPRPRPPAERRPDGRIVDRDGADVTAAFAEGAAATLARVLERRARLAVFKANSPSCGRYRVYDGTFTGTLVPGMGVCARALVEAGVPVVDEHDVADFLAGLDGAPAGFPAPGPVGRRSAPAVCDRPSFLQDFTQP